MKVTRIELENVRRFKGPIVITDLEPGLNLFIGPNGTGKSSLVAALRAAFFERYKTSSVTLRPYDDATVSPRVTIAFETGGKAHELTKQFLGTKRCILHIGPRMLDGEDAEDHLAGLFGYSYAGRGGSKAEHWGIPGLLWMEQGAGQDLADAVGYAKDRLQGALQSMVGAVASTGGDKVIQKLKQQLTQIVTESNQSPRGPYQAAKKAFEDLNHEIAEKSERLETYRADVDRLGKDDAALKQLQALKPWLELEQQAAAAIRQFEAGTRLREDIRQAMQEESDASELVRLFTDQLTECLSVQEALPKAKADLERADDELQEASRLAAGVKNAAEAATQALADARTLLVAAQQREHREQQGRQVTGLGEQIKRAEERLTRAQDLNARRIESQKTIAVFSISDGAVDAVQTFARDIRDLGLQIDAVGTKIEYEVADGTRASIDGNTLAGIGTCVIDSQASVVAEGLAITLTPGGEELPHMRAQREALKSQLSQVLADLGMPTVAALEEKAAKHAAAVEQHRSLRLQVDQLAPEGIEQLERDLAEMRGQLEAAQADLRAIPTAPKGAELLSVDQAASREVLAAETNEQQREAQMEASTRCRLAASARQAAADEVERLSAKLADPEWEVDLRKLREDITAAAGRRTQAQSRGTTLSDQLSKVDMAQLEQDAKRLKASATQIRQQYERLNHSLIALRTKVETVGGEGLEEKLSLLALKREKAVQRVSEFAHQVQVIKHLLDLLEPRRDRVRQKLMAPLQSRIDHYLRMLMPGKRLHMADDLAPTQLVNDADSRTQGEFDMQSFGTREQLALICRLAYADLLKESGTPTLLILDDALVHTDDDRLAAMKRILFDAAERHQILMMTCHPRRWQDLGAKTTTMADLVGG